MVMLTEYATFPYGNEGAMVTLGHFGASDMQSGGYAILLRSPNGIITAIRKFHFEDEFVLACQDLTAYVALDIIHSKNYAEIIFCKSIMNSIQEVAS
jgi:hypothetical protein